MSNLYNEDSTKHISPREFTRLRAGTYCGSTEYSTQLLKEIIANSIDEHLIGHGNKIQITIDTKKNEYTVEDWGQGFVVGAKRDNGETMLSECFSVINTSGKYDDSDDSVYGGAVAGLNGIGLKLVCYLSQNSSISTTDGSGQRETCYYKDGLFEKREYSAEKKEKRGTIINYIPDPQFFQHKEVNIDEIKTLLKYLSALCPSLTIILKIDTEEEIYHSDKGLDSLVDEIVNNKEIISNRFRITKKENNSLIDICLTYTSNYTENVISFVNYGLTEKGIHLTTLKTNLTKIINKFAKENNLLKNENNLTGAELAEGLVLVFNLKAKGVAYDAQNKERVVDIDKSLISEVINNDFYQWLSTNLKSAKTIIEKALSARKAKDAARKAREAVRAKGDKKKGTLLNLPTKLVDSWSKKRKDCELLVCEGDSAASGLIEARDSEFQAVFPVRGKVLNLYKCTDEKTFANQEIVNIIKALGLELDIKTKTLIYDADRLRYGRIILACDGDPDGEAIKNLLLTALWSLCPRLIIEGHVHVAVPPLFRITTKKNQYIYLKDKNALEEYKDAHKGEMYLVNRNKGLGEQDSTELSECLLDPATRNVLQITVKDIEKTEQLFEILMGKRVPIRREYLLNHAEEAII